MIYEQHNEVNHVNRVNRVGGISERTSSFVLNQQKSISKKRKACDRDNYKVKHNSGSSTVTFSTAAFELFRCNVFMYLKQNSYGYQLTESKDIPGNVTHDILRVFIETCGQVSNLYTVNVYRTTSRIMVNGPQYIHFVSNDLPQITTYIESHL